ncbi:hypothetical protein HU200_040475 [Digitaria exilis]|uniref:Uncharacterized protein n=1 Tax=Digitaria exilis TaxID=1010633 RepID=A0A835EHH7_9POAL|nr:hypothetical protein HU200_040475 [Digitaria exilis]
MAGGGGWCLFARAGEEREEEEREEEPAAPVQIGPAAPGGVARQGSPGSPRQAGWRDRGWPTGRLAGARGQRGSPAAPHALARQGYLAAPVGLARPKRPLVPMMFYLGANGGRCWRSEGEVFPMCRLDHLKIVYVSGFRCYRPQIELLHGILGNGAVLEQLLIDFTQSNGRAVTGSDFAWRLRNSAAASRRGPLPPAAQLLMTGTSTSILEKVSPPATEMHDTLAIIVREMGKDEGVPETGKTKAAAPTSRPFASLFMHADAVDVALMVLGLVGAIGDGMSTPMMLFSPTVSSTTSAAAALTASSSSAPRWTR